MSTVATVWISPVRSWIMGELWGQFGRGSNAAGTTWILQKVTKRTKQGGKLGLQEGKGENRAERPVGARSGRAGPRGAGVGKRRPYTGGQVRRAVPVWD